MDGSNITVIDTTPPAVPAIIAPSAAGVYADIPNDAYHAGPGISKSGLWTIHTATPAHYKFPPEREETSATTAAKDMGHACHVAILEPESFEAQIMRGPADRRGNNWKDAQAEANNTKRTLLTLSDYDTVLAIRDACHANARIYSILTTGKREIEHSGYWIDEATGQLCRCRPDLYRADLGVIVDLKSTASAHPDAFARSVINYGYHAQEAHYSDGYRALGRQVEGFLFLAWEKKSPLAFALYELPPSIVDEGRAIIRKALTTYDECARSDRWPAYGEEVQELSFKRWSYTLTEAPEQEAA